MFKSRVTKDKVAQAIASIQALAEQRVLVGIPAENAPRAGDKVNNASLGYIHEFGAPEANIPARPHLIPGVNDAQPQIAKAFRAAAKKAVSTQGVNKGALTTGLNSAGLAAQNAVRRRITSGLSPALSANTLRARDRKMIRKNKKGNFFATKTATALAKRKPLIDTSDYLKKITYVIRNAKA